MLIWFLVSYLIATVAIFSLSNVKVKQKHLILFESVNTEQTRLEKKSTYTFFTEQMRKSHLGFLFFT